MSRRLALIAVLVLVAGAFLALGLWLRRGQRASGPLVQGAYLWQRSWSPEVRAAVGRTEGLAGLVVLAAEVDLSTRPPGVAEVDIDPAALRATGKP